MPAADRERPSAPPGDGPLYRWARAGCRGRSRPPLTPFLGSEFDDEAIDAAVGAVGTGRAAVTEPELAAASMLADGRIVGWFQGRMEFGPRALGNRSLLADPRDASLRDRLNSRIKHRESFRPFAASVLEEEAAAWLIRTAAVPGTPRLDASGVPGPARKAVAARPWCTSMAVAGFRPSTTGGTGFHRLISAFFAKTGVPLVLNTSYNDQEPLVLTPDDALACFVRTRIDALFLNNCLVVPRA